MFDKQTTNLEHDYMKINFHNKLGVSNEKICISTHCFNALFRAAC